MGSRYASQTPRHCSMSALTVLQRDTLLRHSRSHHAGQTGLCHKPQAGIDGSVDACQPVRLDFSSRENAELNVGPPMALHPQSLGDSAMQDGGVQSMGRLDDVATQNGMASPEYFTNTVAGTLHMDTIHSGASPGDQYNFLAPMTTEWSMQDMLWTQQFVGNDFDMSVLDFAPASTPSGPFRSVSGSPDTPSTSLDSQSGRSSTADSVIQKRWHTFSEPSPDDEVPDLTQARNQVDEMYHASLTDTLQSGQSDSALPRISFLASLRNHFPLHLANAL